MSRSVSEIIGSEYMQGIPAVHGLAVGTAVVAPSSSLSLSAIVDSTLQTVDKEIACFRSALVLTRQAICESRDSISLSDSLDGTREIFDVYLALVSAEELVGETLMRIRAGQQASSAWLETIADYVRIFGDLEDPYIRQRAEDFRHIGQLVIDQLQPLSVPQFVWPEHTILVGDVSIVDVAKVPVGQLAGVVCRYGSTFSHVVVLARALGVPAVVGLDELPERGMEGLFMMVDGDTGRIFVEPDVAIRKSFDRDIEVLRQASEQRDKMRHGVAVTLDGVRMPILANAGLESDLVEMHGDEFEGIGLYRTEFQFLLCDTFPSEEDQYLIYRSLLHSFFPKPVTVRTLDVGGDKILSYFPVREDNPSLGCRGIRFSLSHPEVFLLQLRALLRANVDVGNLRLMFPMIARMADLEGALDLLGKAFDQVSNGDFVVARPPIGVMIEVPSAVFLMKNIAEKVDFFSVGTNDLTQYILAADRNNSKVTTPYDSYHPAVLSAIRSVVDVAHGFSKTVSVCGEIAGDPVGAVLLIGLGVDELSMNYSSVACVKQAIRDISMATAQGLVSASLVETEGEQVYMSALRKIGSPKNEQIARGAF